MSIDLNVYFNRRHIPTTESWQAALRERGFPFTLKPNPTLEKNSGFMRVDNNGQPSGFEFDIGKNADPEVEELEGFDSVANFRFSRLDETKVAYPAAVVLAG
jgi:hypothetical protein